ncbi:hypothetical protein [Stigmatella erecta]|uniref:Uncharacterized protein n=1 Tax=Stigmatella erecta TaxID=83460 RepID=A0A1I0J9Z0_9BACT|nr:hypothetical protein [Stigmatella erecta]SEU06825.1 hypothetical protein SAMN05443639_10793 [Stigmatella erecta]
MENTMEKLAAESLVYVRGVHKARGWPELRQAHEERFIQEVSAELADVVAATPDMEPEALAALTRLVSLDVARGIVVGHRFLGAARCRRVFVLTAAAAQYLAVITRSGLHPLDGLKAARIRDFACEKARELSFDERTDEEVVKLLERAIRDAVLAAQHVPGGREAVN